MWELFIAGFAYAEPCNVGLDKFEPFAQAAIHKVPEDMVKYPTLIYHTLEDLIYK